MNDLQKELKNFEPTKEFFIGIDSDGCAFDTMELKHKECFCPNTIKYWDLQKISKYARETWDFVNLYSKNRGSNRFLALVKAMELLAERKEVLSRNVEIPDLSELKTWIDIETKLGNPALIEYAKKVSNPVIATALDWTLAINSDVSDMVHGIPPFPFMKESLKRIAEKADVLVISQTPVDALQREWDENGISKYVKIIAGQEYGTKKEHLQYAAIGKYPADKILMIGDAPGDMEAAKENGVSFFPINPGYEEKSWEDFYLESSSKFFAGEYSGEYEKSLVSYFNSLLPEKPSWN